MRSKLSILIFALGAFLPSVSDAREIASFVVDTSTGASKCWWCLDDAQGISAFDVALAGNQVAAPNPQAVASASRLIRTPELTVNNARNLAGVLSADTAVLGELGRPGDEQLAWLGVTRVAATLSASVIDVRSGNVVRELSLSAVSHAADPEVAWRQACEQLAQNANVLLGSSGAEAPALAATSPVIIVTSTDSALPFVAFRGALRESHRGITDVTEVWAKEGEVALALFLDEDTTFEQVRPSIVALAGLQLAESHVDSVVADGQGLRVRVSLAPPADTSTAP